MRIAILGFGFSGLMAAANLVRAANAPLTLYIIAPEHSGRGVAYSTSHTGHLLNVRAANMGAWADAVEDFTRWIESEEGKYQCAARGIAQRPGKGDFAPRVLYGDYLESIWRSAQNEARDKSIAVKLVPATATRVTSGEALAVMTDRGDAIEVDRVILATGNAVKPIFTQLTPEVVVQNPWQLNEAMVRALLGPVALIGLGLTAVDTILSLRAYGYQGMIYAISRNGLFPRAHEEGLKPYTLDKEALFACRSASTLMHFIRKAIDKHPGDWREVIDSFRPYTQVVWQKLPADAQARLLQRAFTLWNVHRHRMAEPIAARIDTEIAAGTLRVIAAKNMHAAMEGSVPVLTVRTRDGHEEILKPSRIINCTGIELNLVKSTQGLLPQLLRDGLAEAHATGAGFAADKNYALWGVAYPNLFAVGTPMTGQFLESTAVPELRVQAAAIAKKIVS